MIWVTLLASTGGSLTNLEKTWNPGAQTLTVLALMPFSVSMACSAFWIVASRVDSWAPSAPRDLRPYCFKRKPPASLTSNSASLRVPAPKSTARNDFVFSIDCRGFRLGFVRPNAVPTLGQSLVGKAKAANGQMEKRKNLKNQTPKPKSQTNPKIQIPKDARAAAESCWLIF